MVNINKPIDGVYVRWNEKLTEDLFYYRQRIVTVPFGRYKIVDNSHQTITKISPMFSSVTGFSVKHSYWVKSEELRRFR